MKKVISVFLIVILLFSTLAICASAEGSESYVSCSVEYSDKRGQKEKLDLMLKDGNVYVRAEKLAGRLDCTCTASGNTIIIKSADPDPMPFINVLFSTQDTTVRKMLNTLYVDTYEAPFSSIINDKGAWIPLEYTLILLNGGLMIIDDSLLIDVPRASIIDCFTKVANKSDKYSFEWNKDFGYTETDQTIIGITSHMVNLFNGILDFDGYSWAQLFTTIGFSSAGYDAKYGRNLALLICTESDEELKASIEQTNLLLDILYKDGHLRDALDEYSKKTNKTVESLYEKCNSFLEEINAGNSNVVKDYNKTYREFEKAFDKQTWFSNTGERIMDVQDGLSTATKALDAISNIAETVSYAQEFTNQDQFSLNALKGYLKTADTKSDLSDTMRNSMQDYLIASSTDIATYSAYRFFNENIGDLVKKGLDIGEVLAYDANIALFCWNIASGIIPYISNGLDAADKYELALYAQVFQANAHLNYIDKREKTFRSLESISSDNLYILSQYLYTYLKSCYVTRNAALGSLNGKRDSLKEKIQPLFEKQNKINREIAKLMSIVKNANTDNDNNVYGFLPVDNQKYLDEYDGSYLHAFLEEQIKAKEVDVTKLYSSDLIQKVGNDVYYCSSDDAPELLGLPTLDFSSVKPEYQKLPIDEQYGVQSFIIYGDSIFYICDYPNGSYSDSAGHYGKLYKCDLQGENQELIADYVDNLLFTIQDYILTYSASAKQYRHKTTIYSYEIKTRKIIGKTENGSMGVFEFNNTFGSMKGYGSVTLDGGEYYYEVAKSTGKKPNRIDGKLANIILYREDKKTGKVDRVGYYFDQARS